MAPQMYQGRAWHLSSFSSFHLNSLLALGAFVSDTSPCRKKEISQHHTLVSLRPLPSAGLRDPQFRLTGFRDRGLGF